MNYLSRPAKLRLLANDNYSITQMGVVKRANKTETFVSYARPLLFENIVVNVQNVQTLSVKYHAMSHVPFIACSHKEQLKTQCNKVPEKCFLCLSVGLLSNLSQLSLLLCLCMSPLEQVPDGGITCTYAEKSNRKGKKKIKHLRLFSTDFLGSKTQVETYPRSELSEQVFLNQKNSK